MTRQLDLVFLVDTTGSMGSYLRAAQQNIQNIHQEITKTEQVDLRLSIVEYKDHEQNSDFPFLYHDWMTDINDIQRACDEMQPTGGGDGPESIACALDCAVNTLQYRELAAKVIIWIADAPPHGFGDSGDYFPDGCPCNKDFQKTVFQAMENDIQIYSVATEPLNFKHLRDLMRAVAKMTGGHFVPLDNAESLAKVIVAGSLEEIGMTNLMQIVEAKLENVEEFEKMNENEKEKKMRELLLEETKKTTFKQIEINSIYEGELPEIPEIFFTAKDMKELRDHLKTMKESVYKLKNKNQSFSFGFVPHKVKTKVTKKTVKEVEMELCDDDDFEEYISVLDGEKMEEEIEFKEGEVVRMREKAVDEVRSNKLLERLKKKFLK